MITTQHLLGQFVCSFCSNSIDLTIDHWGVTNFKAAASVVSQRDSWVASLWSSDVRMIMGSLAQPDPTTADIHKPQQLNDFRWIRTTEIHSIQDEFAIDCYEHGSGRNTQNEGTKGQVLCRSWEAWMWNPTTILQTRHHWGFAECPLSI